MADSTESVSPQEKDNQEQNTHTDLSSNTTECSTPVQDPKKGKTRGRKKTLVGPPYVCQYPNCGKSFQRSEHLSRHKLNHNPKTIFTCSHAGCGKTFVRHDLLARHLKRHEIKLEKQKQENKPSEFLSTVVSNNFKIQTTQPSSKRKKRNDSPNNDILSQSNKTSNTNPVTVKDLVEQHSATPPLPPLSNMDLQVNSPQVATSNLNTDMTNAPSGAAPNLFSWLFTDPSSNSNNLLPTQNTEHYFNSNNPMERALQAKIDNEGASNNNQSSQPNFNSSYPTIGSNNDISNSNFLNELNEFHMNNNTHNFFIVQDDFSPASSSGYYSSTPDRMVSNHPEISNSKKKNVQSDKEKGLHSFQQSQGHQVSEPLAYQFDEGLLYTLTDEQMKEFEILIPALKNNHDFTKPKFEKALKTYWNFFHPRFPMLHRPTFNSTDSPILLLLAMIVIGSKLFMCVDNITCPDNKRISQPKVLSDTIAEPLRWLLFASPFFQPPAEVWIIQSLLMLEFYEKHCSNRRLHERSHLHHGTTIQLLRRSPTLGGASTKFNNESITEDTDNWYKWIEIESMKRTTFMCFYMDAIDAICMGHQMFIYSHQIQMTMPVEDVVWESNFNQFSRNFKNSKRPQQFLIVLKNVMNGKPARTNSFGKKILLAGLSAILFQIQQRDLQLFFGLDKFTNTISENWRDLLTAAFAIWRNDVGGSCCSSKTAIENLNALGNSSQFSTSDTRCKCISYHLAHIYMSISHYDIFIVCGAPWRMNVKPSSLLERQSIKNRVFEWSKTRHCEVSIVQCYLCLFEMFLSPEDATFEYQYNYLPDADLFFRSYSLGYMVLVLWGYLYAKNRFDKIDVNHTNNKNGYLYLKKMREQFSSKSGVSLHTWYNNQPGASFYGYLMKWANVVNQIEGMENMIGLLELVGNKFVTADYAVVREIGKLLLFCKDRMIGATNKEILDDMYITD